MRSGLVRMFLRKNILNLFESKIATGAVFQRVGFLACFDFIAAAASGNPFNYLVTGTFEST